MSKSISQLHSIFEQPWLDAVAPGHWDGVEIEEDGRMFAWLPSVFKKKFDARVAGEPQLTQTLGPWIEYTSDTPINPEIRNGGSGPLVHWTATQAASFAKAFDFECSMIESVEEFYRGCDAARTPYMSVSKGSRSIQFAMAARRLLIK